MHILKQNQKTLLQHENKNTQKVKKVFNSTFHIQSGLKYV